MKRYIKDCRGAISAYLLAIFLIVCILLPVLIVLIQRQAVVNSITQAQDCIQMTAHSAYMSLMPEFYSERQLKLEPEKFSNKFTQLLTENIQLSFANAEIKEITVYNESFPVECSKHGVFNNPGVHVVIRIKLPRPVFHLLVPMDSQESLYFDVHSDVIFSLN